ncbi:hypothetical protein GYB22_00650 [bacterium]|nr:hypothetical protein [bacterium]
MAKKSLQNILIIAVIALVVILIAVKYMYNVQSNKFQWTDEDRKRLVEQCILDTEGYAIRFPKITQEYCECSTDSIMAHFKKADYLQIENSSYKERAEKFLPVIKDCYNTYQNGIFERSEMPD